MNNGSVCMKSPQSAHETALLTMLAVSLFVWQTNQATCCARGPRKLSIKR